MTFVLNGSEQMRLTSTGLGIGTTSIGERLVVSGNASVDVYKLRSNTSAPASTDAFIYRPADNTIGFGTGSAEKMRLDSSGNLGLGVTPSGWGSGQKAIQIGATGALYTPADRYLSLGSNFYDNGTNGIYLTTGHATNYQQNRTSGVHAWYNAPSGTAGNAITFTQAMSLTADGSLLVGTTTEFAKLSVIVPTGANRNLIQAGVTSATDGLTVKWNNATSTIRVNIQNLPTSATGLASGDLWNDGGTLKIA